MNWIEIDRILYNIIDRHNTVEDMLTEARKQFKWTQDQAEAAVLPLLKRNSFLNVVAKQPEKQSKRLTKRK